MDEADGVADPVADAPMAKQSWKTWTARAAGTAVALTLLAAAVGYLQRDWLTDGVIRDQLTEAGDYSFIEDDGHLRVLLCGTGSPEPSAARAQACTLVSVGGQLFVFAWAKVPRNPCRIPMSRFRPSTACSSPTCIPITSTALEH